MFRASYMWIVVLAAIAASLGLYVEHLRVNPPPPPGVEVASVGDHRPDPALTDIDGKPHRLAEWNGKRILINFWAAWCGPCRQEMPMLAKAQQRYAAHGVQVIGIAEDDPAAVRAYLQTMSLDYPILFSGEHASFPSLNFGNTREMLPYSVLIGRDGVIVKRKLGPFSEAELDSWLSE
jgi:thiol-disulfide isomerase/thioredoxin